MHSTHTQIDDIEMFRSCIDGAEERVVEILRQHGGEIDICDYDCSFPHGIGYNELRFIGMDGGKPYFESQNVHDTARGEDEYKRYGWSELTDYEREAMIFAFDNLKLEDIG